MPKVTLFNWEKKWESSYCLMVVLFGNIPIINSNSLGNKIFFVSWVAIKFILKILYAVSNVDKFFYVYFSQEY